MQAAVVIGAGQAGLSAAHHLLRKGLRPETDVVVLDANEGPGGAWRHRWPSLTLGRAHRVYDLPGFPLGTPDPDEPSSAVVSRYYAEYERRFGLPVHRPVRVRQVVRLDARDGVGGGLEVRTDAGTWRSRFVVNATGTWDRPYWPYYPGREGFRGRQLHTHDFWSVEEFRGLRVVVVGGGTSAVQFLLQLEGVAAATTWVTRRPPQWTATEFDAGWGRDVEDRVNGRTSAGLRPNSVVSVTGLPLNPEYRRGIEAGTLVSAGPMEAVTPGGIRLADGREVGADVVLWATGFRASLDHLAPLQLRESGGGVLVDGVRVVKEPRLFLVGYGASASTLGATRAGRDAALAVVRADRVDRVVAAGRVGSEDGPDRAVTEVATDAAGALAGAGVGSADRTAGASG
ncbi:Predicted flavoprotein CzcO associated with the cation diffusion facilitator CzcD [Raineyella antarctica]|uniref:Predicted flavoprotein CzcO associated with the cation diffusion facilitator CzcD n=1 Tax=Raineyella antarctica TaxID=1577474 RepID=A0A1G6HEG8_9ACTN|nr:FAD-dependent oxidoreductase [Raineyella antarctica]SDB92621.1 Predicted flavoprotein CzcO associated with the cation diffusion facilitator CzcD [Raineyella antarctica]